MDAVEAVILNVLWSFIGAALWLVVWAIAMTIVYAARGKDSPWT